MPDLPTVIKELIAERDRLNVAIEALQGASGRRSRRKGGPHNISAAGRARIVAAQRKRWAKFRAKKK